MSDETGAPAAGLDSVDRVIAVASAKGGVGKSTVAVNLAGALAGEEAVGLFDADLHGPNVPSLLGVSGPVYSDDDGHPLPVDAGGVQVMSVGLMHESVPLAWRGAMAHDALSELFHDTAWDGRDTVVLDLPPGTGDVVLTTLQEVRLDGVVLVTTPFHSAVTDTGRSLQLFREHDVPVLGVVENMGSFACPSCGDEHELFPGDAPLDEVDAPVIASLPFSTAVQGRPAPGEVPGAFDDLAARVRERLDEIWEPQLPAGALDLRGLPGEERPDRVEDAYVAVDPGEPFVVVSDRDPSAVRGFLTDLAGADPAEERFEVRQVNPRTWVLETVRPAAGG